MRVQPASRKRTRPQMASELQLGRQQARACPAFLLTPQARQGAATGDVLSRSSLTGGERPLAAQVRWHELLPLVILRLAPDDRARCALVCRAWRSVVALPSSWEAIDFRGCEYVVTEPTLTALCARAGPLLRKLALTLRDGTTAAAAAAAAAAESGCDGGPVPPAQSSVHADGVVRALVAGGCAGLRELALEPEGDWDWRPESSKEMGVDEDAAEEEAPLEALTAASACALAELAPQLQTCSAWIRCRLGVDSLPAALPGPLSVDLRPCRDLHPVRARIRLGQLPSTQLPPGVARLFLDHYGTGYGPAALPAALHAMSACASLAELELFGSAIEPAGGVAVCEALRTNRTLQDLRLAYTGLDASVVPALAAALRENRTLRILDLIGNNLGDDAGVAIANALADNGALTQLDMSETGVARNTAVALALALGGGGCALESLELDTNAVDSVGAIALSEALLRNSRLTYLGLANNEIRDDGARALAQALLGGGNRTLTMLSLKRNEGISTDAAIAVAHALHARARGGDAAAGAGRAANVAARARSRGCAVAAPLQLAMRAAVDQVEELLTGLFNTGDSMLTAIYESETPGAQQLVQAVSILLGPQQEQRLVADESWGPHWLWLEGGGSHLVGMMRATDPTVLDTRDRLRLRELVNDAMDLGALRVLLGEAAFLIGAWVRAADAYAAVVCAEHAATMWV